MIQSPKLGFQEWKSPRAASTVEARHPRTRRCQGRRVTLDGVRDKNLQQLKFLNPAISPVT